MGSIDESPCCTESTLRLWSFELVLCPPNACGLLKKILHSKQRPVFIQFSTCTDPLVHLRATDLHKVCGNNYLDTRNDPGQRMEAEISKVCGTSPFNSQRACWTGTQRTWSSFDGSCRLRRDDFASAIPLRSSLAGSLQLDKILFARVRHAARKDGSVVDEVLRGWLFNSNAVASWA